MAPLLVLVVFKISNHLSLLQTANTQICCPIMFNQKRRWDGLLSRDLEVVHVEKGLPILNLNVRHKQTRKGLILHWVLNLSKSALDNFIIQLMDHWQECQGVKLCAFCKYTQWLWPIREWSICWIRFGLLTNTIWAITFLVVFRGSCRSRIHDSLALRASCSLLLLNLWDTNRNYRSLELTYSSLSWCFTQWHCTSRAFGFDKQDHTAVLSPKIFSVVFTCW